MLWLFWFFWCSDKLAVICSDMQSGTKKNMQSDLCSDRATCIQLDAFVLNMNWQWHNIKADVSTVYICLQFVYMYIFSLALSPHGHRRTGEVQCSAESAGHRLMPPGEVRQRKEEETLSPKSSLKMYDLDLVGKRNPVLNDCSLKCHVPLGRGKLDFLELLQCVQSYDLMKTMPHDILKRTIG